MCRKKIITLIGNLFAVLFGFTQSKDCEVLNTVLSNIHSKYSKVYISDSFALYDSFLQRKVVLFSRSTVSKKHLRKAFLKNENNSNLFPVKCFADSLVGNKKTLIKKAKGINPASFIRDSPFVKVVDKRYEEISNISDEEERFRQLHKLQETNEFIRYSNSLDFFTPRIIEFLKPIFVKNYSIVFARVLKDFSDDRYSWIFLYKKNKSGWELLKNEHVNE
jgi:hypothetical protein